MDAVTPVTGHELHVQPPAPCHGLPQSREVTGFKREDSVSWRDRIDDTRFPGPGAGGGKHHHGLGGLKNRSTAVQNRLCESRKLRTAMIDDGAIHGSENAVRNIGGAWDLQEMAAWAIFYVVLPKTEPDLACQRGFENTRQVHGRPACVIRNFSPGARAVGHDER